MKKIGFTLLLLSILALTACNSTDSDLEETTEPTTEPALEQVPEGVQPDADQDIIPRVTITPTPVLETAPEGAYPADQPTATPYPEGYPVPAVSPTKDPYPADGDSVGDSVWVLKPAGKQCEESLEYETEKDAQASLEAAGVETFSVKTINIPVISVCGGATSTQYLVEIGAGDATSAETLGWRALSIDEVKELEGE